MAEDIEKSNVADSAIQALPVNSAIHCFACGRKVDLSGSVPGSKKRCDSCEVEITVPDSQVIAKLASFQSFSELPDEEVLEEVEAPKNVDVPHKIFCQSCNAKIDVTGQPIGSKFSCPACGTVLKVPPRDEIVAVDANAVPKKKDRTGAIEKLKINCHTCGAKIDVTGEVPFRKVNCPSCNAQFAIPKRFGHFLLEEQLGENENFTVYRALDLTLSREVCLKVMSEKLSGNTAVVEQFLAEAGKAALINDPNVVPIFSSGDHEGCSYLVMQFMSALSLKPYLEKSRGILPLSSVYRVIRDASKGLDAANERGITHNNITLTNILLDRDGNVKVADFSLDYSLHKILGGGKKDLLKFFDPQYISIEMVKGESNGLAGDIYSLGAVFYHLLTGVPPFPGNSPEVIINERLERSPVHPSKVRSEIPQAVADFIMKMLSEDPADRPRSYQEVIQNLEAFAGNTTTFKKPMEKKIISTKPVEQSSEVVNSPVSASLPMEQVVSKDDPLAAFKKVNPVVYGVAAGLLAAAVVALSIMGKEEKPSEPTLVNSGHSVEELISKKAPTETGGVAPVSSVKTPEDKPVDSVPNLTGPVVPKGFMVNRSQRPMPDGIAFKAHADELLVYLGLHDGDAATQEAERLKMLRNVKPYLEQLMNFVPFKGQILVKNRNPLDGEIVSADGARITIKANASDQTLALSWQQFDVKQFMLLLQFYIDLRVEQLADATEDERPQLQRDIAADYFRLALICDWYGLQADLDSYISKAYEADATLRPQIEAYLPSVGE